MRSVVVLLLFSSGLARFGNAKVVVVPHRGTDITRNRAGTQVRRKGYVQ